MIDPFGRRITYLRVSVTDRCDLRCVYCMAEEMQFLPRSEVLSLEELDRLCSAFIRQGVRKLRITGGEPLVRRDVLRLFRSLGNRLGEGLDELTLTTNGTQLAKHARDLVAAGVRRVNVSLDTLDPARFTAITRWGRIERVLEGIEAASAAGLHVKINAVALKGVNDDELPDLLDVEVEPELDFEVLEPVDPELCLPCGRNGLRLGPVRRAWLGVAVTLTAGSAGVEPPEAGSGGS